MVDKHSACDGKTEIRRSDFQYNYIADKHTIEVCHLESGHILKAIKCSSSTRKNISLYLDLLDKTVMTEAMILSDRKTCSLPQLFEIDKLSAILDTSVRLASYAYALNEESFKIFSDRVAVDYGIYGIACERKTSVFTGQTFFSVQINFYKDVVVNVTSKTLYKAMRKLSQKIIAELVPEALSNQEQENAYNFLTFASHLSLVRHVLDPYFDPRMHVYALSQEEQKKLI